MTSKARIINGDMFTFAPDREGRVYLAGPMSNIPEHNFPLFNQVAKRLRGLGIEVENPAEHGEVEGAEWADYLRHDLLKIARCDTLMLLPGWEASRGAQLEYAVAEALSMHIVVIEAVHEDGSVATKGAPLGMEA